jgi:hypothetical protein
MAKCTRCSNEIELSEMMEMLVAVKKAQGSSFGLLCPDCRPVARHLLHKIKRV